MVCLIHFSLKKKLNIIFYIFSLTFVYSPPSDTYGYRSVELIPNGSHIVRELRRHSNIMMRLELRIKAPNKCSTQVNQSDIGSHKI